MPSRVLAEPPIPVPVLVPMGRAHDGNVRHKFLLPLAAAAAIAAALSIFIAAVIGVLLYRRCSKNRTAPEAAKISVAAAASGIPVLRRFTYAQLRRATASFSQANRLGQGGFGPVFRGSLSTGQDIAVKVMDSGSLQGEREFQNELSLAETILSQQSLDKKLIVAPLGFCVAEKRERRRGWWRWRRKDSSSITEVADHDIEEDESSRRLLLVYELMQNGSLQDALLLRRCSELADWARRFSVAIDISRGLQFLHCACYPPVIHGDIKPSNILLDSTFSGRIADLGLSRLKSDEQQQPPQVDENQNSTNNNQVPASSEISIRVPAEEDASMMGETLEESTNTTNYLEETAAVPQVTGKSPEDDECSARVPESYAALEVASTSDAVGFDQISVDSGITDASGNPKSGRRKISALSGKDWWWRQDGNGGANSETGSVKDYVMEWIKSEIKKERPRSSEWIDDGKPRVKPVKIDRKKQQRRLEWWAALDEEKSKKEKKLRQHKEWWREEYCDELANKHKKRMLSKSPCSIDSAGQQWWQKDDEVDHLSPRGRRKLNKILTKRSRSRNSRTSIDRCPAPVRRNSCDRAGSDIPKSSAVSSTPSMRGTVCYVAPEYGGGGPLSEKCDIYSFGVLLLVLISGRRPLQMTASPMSEFEKANLISWARHLARLGSLLDLLDPSLRAVDKDQALLCITVALLCIQKSPSRRPSTKDIVGMLTGQTETPALPMEFSPSPPDRFSFKSTKRTTQ